MKRYSILAAILAGLVIFLLYWRGNREATRTDANPVNEALAVTQSNSQKSAGDGDVTRLAPTPQGTNAEEDYQRLLRERPESAQAFREDPDLPVAFYGLMVDQDSNALANVKVDVEITQWSLSNLPRTALKLIKIEKQTDEDGRFEVRGLNAHGVTIRKFTKDGYEPELIQAQYGEYQAQAGSLDQPKVFRLWNTNLHEPLIAGERKFQIVPDGRHYGIDLIKGAITESNEGDLVVWIKRAESLTRRYDWSCELAVPKGGLAEHGEYVMFRSPEAGYTNSFTLQEQATTDGWSSGFGKKRFYLRLRNGQMYGRIVVSLNVDSPATMRLSYAVNPSGSRILR
jgi:hypothetical protein